MNDGEMEFKLDEAFFAQFRRATVTRALPMMLLAAGAGLVVVWGRSEMPAGLMALVSCFVLVVVGVSIWRNYQKQIEHLRSLRIVLGVGCLQRLQRGLKDVCIHAADISRVVTVPGKSLMVYGASSQDVIVVPETIQGFSQIREAVGSWCRLEVKQPSPLSRTASTIAGIATIAGIVVVFMSNNSAIVIPVGLVLIALLGWAVVSVRRSPHLEARVKRIVWVALIPMASIAARVWQLLQGGPGG